MSRVAVIRFPGGAEIATQQNRTSLVDDESTPPPDTEEIADEGVLSGLSPTKAREIRSFVKSHRITALMWAYRYLNFFLVSRTQFVLDWLVRFPEPTTSSFYHSLFMQMVPSAHERLAMISALESHHLITLDDGTDTIRVTSKGRAYQQWRSALLPPPNGSA